MSVESSNVGAVEETVQGWQDGKLVPTLES